MNPYVIIGTSAAGLSVAATLRSFNQDIEIICVSDESDYPYNKCRLMDYLSDSIMLEQVFTRPLSWFKDQRISLRLNTKVVLIDRIAQLIQLSDGSLLRYQKLFLGMGASNRSLHVAAVEQKKNIFEVRSLADVNRLKCFMSSMQNKRIMIVGCGLTGLELADALYTDSRCIVMVDRAGYPFKNYVSSKAGDFIKSHLQQKNIACYFNNAIEAVEVEGDWVKSVKISDGTIIFVDLILVAIGTFPAIDLAVAAGLVCDAKGIVVNEYFQTSDDNIYAGGDVSGVHHAIIGQRIRSSKWSDAVMHGMHAARAMLGYQDPYLGLFSSISTQFFGMHCISSGFLETVDQDEIIEHYSETMYRLLIVKNNIIKRFCLINDQKSTEIRQAFARGLAIESAFFKYM